MQSWKICDVIADPAEHVSKYVFKNDSAVAEAVLYRYPDYRTRTVICCSTQAGCPVGCRFCGAGNHFVRSLTTDEIVSQPTRLLSDVGFDASEIGRLQIMFMSMGEPLLNQGALIPALHELHRLYPTAALLISTSAPDVNYTPIIRVSRDIPTIGLQFSVHETTDAARDKLIPFVAKLPLREIAIVGENWHREVGRKPFFNYCVHDANSMNADADRLIKLFNPVVWCATVSVICEQNEGMPATNDHQRGLAADFGAKLVARGFDVRVFDPAGQDTIGGGCGQLWFVQQWLASNSTLARPSVGYNLPKVHVPSRTPLS